MGNGDYLKRRLVSYVRIKHTTENFELHVQCKGEDVGVLTLPKEKFSRGAALLLANRLTKMVQMEVEPARNSHLYPSVCAVRTESPLTHGERERVAVIPLAIGRDSEEATYQDSYVDLEVHHTVWEDAGMGSTNICTVRCHPQKPPAKEDFGGVVPYKRIEQIKPWTSRHSPVIDLVEEMQGDDGE